MMTQPRRVPSPVRIRGVPVEERLTPVAVRGPRGPIEVYNRRRRLRDSWTPKPYLRFVDREFDLDEYYRGLTEEDNPYLALNSLQLEFFVSQRSFVVKSREESIRDLIFDDLHTSLSINRIAATLRDLHCYEFSTIPDGDAIMMLILKGFVIRDSNENPRDLLPVLICPKAPLRSTPLPRETKKAGDLFTTLFSEGTVVRMFEMIIKHGLEFGTLGCSIEKYKDRDLLSLAGNDFLDQVARYPPVISAIVLVSVIKKKRPTLVTIAKLLGYDELAELLSSPELVGLISRGYLDPHSKKNAEERLERLAQLRSYPAGVINTLINTLGVESIYELAMIPEMAAEAYMLRTEKEGFSAIGEEIGIVIPSRGVLEKSDYIARGIVQHELHLRHRRGDFGDDFPSFSLSDISMMDFYSDRELLNFSKIIYRPKSRHNLLCYLSGIMLSPNFFFTRSRKAYNETTTLGTSIHDPGLSVIAFGNLEKFRLYEYEEIEMSFSNGMMRIPETPNKYFSRAAVQSFIDILENTNRWTDLLEEAKNALLFGEPSFEFRVKWEKFTRVEQELLGQFFGLFFQCGMYFRGWRGPGDEFPLKRDQTYNSEAMDNGVRALSRLTHVLERMTTERADFARSLPIVKTDGVQIVLVHQTSIGDLLATVSFYREDEDGLFQVGESQDEIEVDSCIRVSSSAFIVTGAYYMKTLAGESIHGVDLTKLENVM